jgi:hypothetical protein
MNFQVRFAAFAIGALLLLGGRDAQAVTHTLTASPDPVAVGGMVTFTLNGPYESAGNTIDLLAYDLDFAFDSTKLEYQAGSATTDAALFPFPGALYEDQLGGPDTLFVSDGAGLVTGSGDILTLVFKVLASGSHNLSMTGLFRDSNDGSWDVSALGTVSTLATSAVPLPAAVVLFPAGFAGLTFLLSRRRRRQGA